MILGAKRQMETKYAHAEGESAMHAERHRELREENMALHDEKEELEEALADAMIEGEDGSHLDGDGEPSEISRAN